MKGYVCHYSKNIERKKELSADPRFQELEDVTWIDWYDKEDIECYWIKSACLSTMSLEEISCALKHYEAMYHMVKNDIEEAVILEDDVVFVKDWLKILDKHKDQVEFMRLDSLFHMTYDGNIKTTEHLWPAEAWYIKKDFAKFILTNATFSIPIDNFVYRYLLKMKMQIPILPLCSQTSALTKLDQVFKHDTVWLRDDIEWKHYNYIETKQLLLEAASKKIIVEAKFFEKYGRKIDLKMPAYLELNDLGTE